MIPGSLREKIFFALFPAPPHCCCVFPPFIRDSMEHNSPAYVCASLEHILVICDKICIYVDCANGKMRKEKSINLCCCCCYFYVKILIGKLKNGEDHQSQFMFCCVLLFFFFFARSLLHIYIHRYQII